MYKIPLDYHIHTRFSCDSQATMAEMCRAAIEQDIPEIGFSEHFDLMPQDPCYKFFRAEAFWKSLQRCRDEFKGSLTIRAGIEIGEPHRFQDAVQILLGQFPWDYSLASLHYVGSMNVYDLSYFEQPPDQAYLAYYNEMTKMVDEADFDILAHMDMVKRKGFDIYGSYDPYPFETEIRSVLRCCAARELALEVNTATLRRPIGQPAPSRVILEWFKEEGGRWITLGSDAHRPEQIGFGFEQAIGAIHSAGFTHLARFETREPFPVNFA